MRTLKLFRRPTVIASEINGNIILHLHNLATRMSSSFLSSPEQEHHTLDIGSPGSPPPTTSAAPEDPSSLPVFQDETEDFLDEPAPDPEPDEGEELFGDDMERDYRPIPQLDVYGESSMLDETGSFLDLSPGARVSAEADMRRRDRLMGVRKGGMRRGLLYDTDDEDEEVEVEERSRRRKSERLDFMLYLLCGCMCIDAEPGGGGGSSPPPRNHFPGHFFQKFCAYVYMLYYFVQSMKVPEFPIFLDFELS